MWPVVARRDLERCAARPRGPRSARGWLALLLVVGTSLAAHAQAQPPLAAPVERPLAEVVQLEPGASCLELQRLTLRVGRWRERDTVDPRIRVSVQGDPHVPTQISFRVNVEGGAHAERTITDAPTDCDQLHSAVALSIAMAIDATLTAGNPNEPAVELPPPAPAAPEPAAPALLPPDLHAPPAPPPTAADVDAGSGNNLPPHLELGVFAGASSGLLSDTSLVLAPRLAYSFMPWLSVAAMGFGTTLSDQTITDTSGHFDSGLFAAGLDACAGHELIEGFELRGCLGARAGALQATGRGYPRTFGGSEPWLAGVVSLHARAWLSPWAALGVAVEGVGPFARHVILLRGDYGAPDRFKLLPSFGLMTTIGPVFRFF